jgi:hypothetical protein
MDATSERFMTAANNSFSELLLNVSCSLVVTVPESLRRQLTGDASPLVLLFDLTVTSGMDENVVTQRISDGLIDGTFVRSLKRMSGLNVTSIVPFALKSPTSSPVQGSRGIYTMRCDAMLTLPLFFSIYFSSLPIIITSVLITSTQFCSLSHPLYVIHNTSKH